MTKINNEILWFLPASKFRNSGVYKYNYQIIKLLKKNKITKVSICKSKNIFLILLSKYIIYPIWITFNSFKYKKIILPDESFAFYGLFCLFNNAYLIVHDFRKIYSISKKLSSKEYLKQILLNFNFFFINSFKKIIVPSKFTKKILIKEFPKLSKKILILPNIIESKKINSLDFKKFKKYISKLTKGKKIILNISSPEKRKNQFKIIKLSEYKNNNFFYIIIGTKKNFINKNSMQMKSVNENKIPFFYKICDLYLDLSEFEGFGRTGLEAQSYGKKVACLNTKINIENFDNTCFYIKSKSNIKKIKKRIKKILFSSNRIKVYLKNSAKFSSTNVKRKYFKILNEIK